MVAARRLLSRRRIRRALLVSGILASLLYVATDITGGLLFEGYSFSSQAISELMASGAPSERFVDPLFLAFGLLTLAFGAGVYLAGRGRSRPLRVAGVLIAGYAVLGLTARHSSRCTRAGRRAWRPMPRTLS